MTSHLRTLIASLLLAAPAQLAAQPRQSEAPKQPVGKPAAAPADPAATQTAQADADASAETTAADAVAAPATDQTAPLPKSFIDRGRAFIGHVPRSSAEVGNVVLKFDVRGADLAGQIVVRYRALTEPEGRVQQVTVKRGEGGYGAVLPLSKTAPPGVVYWVVERMADGTEHPVFASAQEPQPLILHYDSVHEREQRALRRVGGNRSTLGVRGELVSLGAWDLPAGEPKPKGDRYWQVELQYAYRFFQVIDELRVGLGKMEADVLEQGTEAESGATDCPQGRVCIGLEYGRADTVVAFSDLVRARAGVLLGFSDLGFAYGFRGGLILGSRDRMELEFGGELINTINDGNSRTMGATGGVRLGWNTIPRFPMGASIDVTNFPTGDEPGVWLKLDAGYAIYPGALVKLIGGYRGRTSLAGGPSLGLETHLAF